MRLFVYASSAVISAILTACATAPSGQRLGPEDLMWAARSAQSQSYSSFLIGRYASLTSDPGEAARRYADAVSREPNDPGLLERAVFSALLAGETQLAWRLAETSPEGALASASLARLTHGVDLLRDGKSREARRMLSSGEFGAFNGLVARGVSAWAALETGGLEAAEATLLEGRSGDALLDGLSIYSLALLQAAAGEDGAALATFESGWRTGLRLGVATDAYARLLARMGRRDEAIGVLTDFARTVGPNASVDALRADLEAGLPVSVKRPTVKQGAALAIYTPASALRSRTDSDVSGVYFALALSLDPNLDIARTSLGDALDNAGRRDDAIDVLERVDRTSVYYAAARGQLAWVLRREERNDEALSVAAEALAAQPDRDLKIQLGDLYRSLDRHAAAETVFSEIIATDETEGVNDWRLHYARGVARERLGRWREAEADLRTALKAAPDQPELLNYLGYSLVDRGEQIEEAFDMIRRAVELRPDAGYIIDSLGWAYYRLGRYSDAVEHLERAVELTPGDPTINDHLGDAYWHVGRRNEAQFQWDRALSLAPTVAEERLIRAKLDNGLGASGTPAALDATFSSGLMPNP